MAIIWNMKEENTEPLMAIGQQLKSLRKRHYPSDDQDAFAIRIGVSRNTYRKMEQGNGNVSFSSYLNVARLYNVESKILAVFASSGNRNLFEDFAKNKT